MPRKVKCQITAKLIGIVPDAESDEDAQKRIAFEAEQLINSNQIHGIRAHFTLIDQNDLSSLNEMSHDMRESRATEFRG